MLGRSLNGFLLLIGLSAACSGCTSVITAAYTPVVLLHPTMPQALAITTCSLNNQPIVLIDSAVWYSMERETVLAHEQVHAERAARYRGGCWPFMYRIKRDQAFRVREQLLAFCAAGRFAITRNRSPESMWLYIVNVMRPDTLLTDRDNCLYQPWEPQ